MNQHPKSDNRKEDEATETQAWALFRVTSPLAVLGAAISAGLSFVILSTIGAFPQMVQMPPTGEPITLSTVVSTAVIGGLGGVLAFAIINRFTNSPIKIFRRVAIGVLVLSFATPFTIPGVPAAMLLSLLFMHVVVAAVVVVTLTYQG